jgi:CubicO group peptidase (beta-lactamase class C family)
MTTTSAPTSEHIVGKPHARLDELLRREIVEPRVAPAAVVGVVFHSGNHWEFAIGAAGTVPEAIFDLASVTKPLTALAAMRLVDAGRLSLDATVASVLPELVGARGAKAANARLGDLLSHRAGLRAWGAIYREDPWAVGTEVSAPPALDDASPSLDAMLARAASGVDDRPVGRDALPLYSDLGYVLAGAMIARASGAPLDRAWSDLGGPTSARCLRERLRAESIDFDARVLATERVDWRGGDVRGVVHDENAFFLERAGGDPGHAGAFGTATDVATIGIRFLDALDGRDDLLSASNARAMIEPFAIGSNRIGWDGISRPSQSGTRFGPRAFGHLGFTGTSVWIDPDARVVQVLLTNRTYPWRTHVAIRAARPRVHDALWEIVARP